MIPKEGHRGVEKGNTFYQLRIRQNYNAESELLGSGFQLGRRRLRVVLSGIIGAVS